MSAAGRSVGRPVVMAAVLVGAAVVLLALAAIFGTDGAARWSSAVEQAVAPWERGGWKVFRGGLKWIVPPTLVMVVLLCTLRTVRAGRWRAALWSLGTGAATFGVVEGVKLVAVPLPGSGAAGTQDLSGHVAAVAAASVVVLTAVVGRARRGAVALTILALVGAGVGVVVGRWHDVGDVVVATALAGVCAAVAGVLARAAGGGVGRVPVVRAVGAVAATVLVCLLYAANPDAAQGTVRTLAWSGITVAVAMVGLTAVQLWAVTAWDDAPVAVRREALEVRGGQDR